MQQAGRDVRRRTFLVLGLALGGGQPGVALVDQAQALAHGLGAGGAVQAADARRGLHGSSQPQASLWHLLRRLPLCTHSPSHAQPLEICAYIRPLQLILLYSVTGKPLLTGE